MSNQIGLTDVAANEDQFGIEPYINGLTDFIRECKTPMTISIQGTWGTGKTSIMQMIEKRIKSETCQCVKFNTWEFSQFNMEKNLPIVMIQSLISALSGQDKSRGETIGNMINLLASICVGFVSNTGANFKEALQKGYLEQIRGLKKEFQLLVNKKAGLVDDGFKLGKDEKKNEEALSAQSGNKRIVFFIDDLDRLNPEKAVELLEVLKNFLDCKNCVFILAIDSDVVWRGVAAKYGNMIGDDPEEIKKKGKDFFDKIIQVPFKMPVASYHVDDYIKTCLEEINVPVSDVEKDIYHTLVRASIGTNPRSLKRIVNSFALLIKVIGNKRLEEMNGYKLLFAVLCMQHAYEVVYNYLVLNREKLNYNQLEALAKGDYETAFKLMPDMEISKDDFEDIQPFMQVFVEKAVDLNGNGKVDVGGSNDEIAYLKEILNMSSVTSDAAENPERKKVSLEVNKESLKHIKYTDEQVEYIFSLVDRVLEGKDGYEVKFVNTKGYGHAEYKYKKKKFIDVYFYDDDRGYVEIGCIPRDVSLWDRTELSEICKKRGIMKGISYFSSKGISYKYRFNGDIFEDEEFLKLAKACVDDVFLG